MPRGGGDKMEGFAMPDVGSLTTWLPGPVLGSTTNSFGGGGVELDSRFLMLDQFRALGMVMVWIMACVAKLLLSVLPGLLPLPLLTNFLEKLSAAGDGGHGVRHQQQQQQQEGKRSVGRRHVKLSGTAIGRALTQVLFLVNDVPASSNKYAYLQSLADKVIEENKVGGVTYEALNQEALGTGFARTIYLLGQSLEGRRQHETIFGRLVKNLPIGSNIGFLAPLVKIPSLLTQVLYSVNPWTSSPDSKATLYPRNVADADLPEKFAKELLWLAEKLLDCGGMEEAIQQWSTNPSLAELSLCASPRVQKSLVRLSALLCKGLVGETNIPQEACMKLVLLWLPLLCNATHGGDGPIFSSSEKCDAERLLEQAIMGLPQADQELILSTWLQEYAMSQSDWPNLQNCFNKWCHATRKLEHAKTEVID